MIQIAQKLGLISIFERIERTSVRERLIMFITAIISLYLLSLIAVIKPLGSARNKLEHEIQTTNSNISTLAQDIRKLASDLEKHPDDINRARIAELETQLRDAHGALSTLTNGLISPRDMSRLVESMLASMDQIEVVSMENLPPVPLVIDAGAPGDKQTSAAADKAAVQTDPASVPDSSHAVYKHGLRIEVKGRYADIAAFLRALEGLSWKVLWNDVVLETEKYPISRASLNLYTLSLDQAWIAL